MRAWVDQQFDVEIRAVDFQVQDHSSRWVRAIGDTEEELNSARVVVGEEGGEAIGETASLAMQGLDDRDGGPDSGRSGRPFQECTRERRGHEAVAAAANRDSCETAAENRDEDAQIISPGVWKRRPRRRTNVSILISS